jgi:thiol-disulfide isomerase/thioredoxin
VDSDANAGQSRTRSRITRLAVGAAVALGLAAAVVLALRPASDRDAGQAPDFTLQALRGDERIESDELRGRPVVLNFWASWCDPCRKEMPLFEQAWQEHQDEGLLIVGVNVMDSPRPALEFLDEIKVTYPIVGDPESLLRKTLNVTGLPQTLFIRPTQDALDAVLGGRIDDGGKLVLGEISEEELDEEIGVILEEG